MVRAEKTRWPAAVNVKEKIVRDGGKIIGAVYNDRRLVRSPLAAEILVKHATSTAEKNDDGEH